MNGIRNYFRCKTCDNWNKLLSTAIPGDTVTVITSSEVIEIKQIKEVLDDSLPRHIFLSGEKGAWISSHDGGMEISKGGQATEEDKKNGNNPRWWPDCADIRRIEVVSGNAKYAMLQGTRETLIFKRMGDTFEHPPPT